MQRGGTVYITTNIHNEVLYVGVTSDLVQRIQQHKKKNFPQAL
jgi:putative endonuclease